MGNQLPAIHQDAAAKLHHQARNRFKRVTMHGILSFDTNLFQHYFPWVKAQNRLSAKQEN
jgi:hypothetical protein